MATGLRSAAEEASVGPSPSAEGKGEEKLRSPPMRTKPIGTILNKYISVMKNIWFFKKRSRPGRGGGAGGGSTRRSGGGGRRRSRRSRNALRRGGGGGAPAAGFSMELSETESQVTHNSMGKSYVGQSYMYFECFSPR